MPLQISVVIYIQSASNIPYNILTRKPNELQQVRCSRLPNMCFLSYNIQNLYQFFFTLSFNTNLMGYISHVHIKLCIRMIATYIFVGLGNRCWGPQLTEYFTLRCPLEIGTRLEVVNMCRINWILQLTQQRRRPKVSYRVEHACWADCAGPAHLWGSRLKMLRCVKRRFCRKFYKHSPE